MAWDPENPFSPMGSLQEFGNVHKCSFHSEFNHLEEDEQNESPDRSLSGPDPSYGLESHTAGIEATHMWSPPWMQPLGDSSAEDPTALSLDSSTASSFSSSGQESRDSFINPELSSNPGATLQFYVAEIFHQINLEVVPPIQNLIHWSTMPPQLPPANEPQTLRLMFERGDGQLSLCGRGLASRGSKLQLYLPCECTVGVVDQAGRAAKLRDTPGKFEIILGPGLVPLDLRLWHFKVPARFRVYHFRVVCYNRDRSIKYEGDLMPVRGRPKKANPRHALIMEAPDSQMRIADALRTVLHGHSRVNEWAMNLGGVETLGHLRMMKNSSFKELLQQHRDVTVLKDALKRLRKNRVEGYGIENQDPNVPHP